jgi:hypothetical protein
VHLNIQVVQELLLHLLAQDVLVVGVVLVMAVIQTDLELNTTHHPLVIIQEVAVAVQLVVRLLLVVLVVPELSL